MYIGEDITDIIRNCYDSRKYRKAINNFLYELNGLYKTKPLINDKMIMDACCKDLIKVVYAQKVYYDMNTLCKNESWPLFLSKKCSLVEYEDISQLPNPKKKEFIEKPKKYKTYRNLEKRIEMSGGSNSKMQPEIIVKPTTFYFLYFTFCKFCKKMKCSKHQMIKPDDVTVYPFKRDRYFISDLEEIDSLEFVTKEVVMLPSVEIQKNTNQKEYAYKIF